MNGPASPRGILLQATTTFRKFYDEAEKRLAIRRNLFAALFCASASIFALRLVYAASYAAAGGDYGHYLATAHWLAGIVPTEFGNEGFFGYSVLLLALIAVLPEPTATLVSGPLVLAALVPAMYFLGRRFVPRSLAISCGVLVSLMQSFSDMIGYGGNPNILAITFSLVMWGSLIDVVRDEPPAGISRPAVRAGFALALVVLTHSFTAFVSIVAVAFFVGFVFALRPSRFRPLVRPLALFLVIGAGLSIIAVPNYLTLINHAVRPSQDAGVPVFTAFSDSLRYLFRGTLALWAVAGAFTGFAAIQMVRRRDVGGAYMASALAIPFILALTLFNDFAVRTLIFVNPPLCLGLFVGAKFVWDYSKTPRKRLLQLRRASIAALAVAFLVMVPTSSMDRQAEANRFYYFLTPDDLRAVEWLRDQTPSTAVVATLGPFDYDPDGRVGNTYGWWIEGYGRRAALPCGMPEDFAFDYQWQAVRDANRIFAGDRVAENGLLRVAMPRALSTPFQPTFSIGWGADYRQIVYGQDLAVVWGGETTWMGNGTGDDSSTNEVEGNAAFLNSSATVAGPGMLLATVSASLDFVENRSSLEVRVDAVSPAPISLVKHVRITPDARLKSVTNEHGLHHFFEFELDHSEQGHSEQFLLALSSADPKASVGVAWTASPIGTIIELRVQSPANSTSVSVAFDWLTPKESVSRDRSVRLFSFEALLTERSVTHLFIPREYTDQMARFDAPTSSLRRAFENERVVIYSRT